MPSPEMRISSPGTKGPSQRPVRICNKPGWFWITGLAAIHTRFRCFLTVTWSFLAHWSTHIKPDHFNRVDSLQLVTPQQPPLPVATGKPPLPSFRPCRQTQKHRVLGCIPLFQSENLCFLQFIVFNITPRSGKIASLVGLQTGVKYSWSCKKE